MDKTTTAFHPSEGGPRSRRLRPVAIVALWIAAVAGGSAAMLHYEFTEGRDPHAPAHWPAASRIPRTEGQPTLVVFAHPRCPCTAATFDELDAVIATAGSGTRVSVLFFTPADAGEDWTEAPSVSQAAAIAGVNVIADGSAREARLFNALTSGRTLLYDPNGELLFDGGITGSRGHTGENAGAATLAALLAHETSARATAPVFGCPILQRPSQSDSASWTR